MEVFFFFYVMNTANEIAAGKQTKQCLECGKPFNGDKRQIVCSAECRKTRKSNMNSFRLFKKRLQQMNDAEPALEPKRDWPMYGGKPPSTRQEECVLIMEQINKKTASRDSGISNGSQV